MNTITLTETQASHLAKHGRVLVIEPAVGSQCDGCASGARLVGGLHYNERATVQMACTSVDYSPHQPDDVVAIRATKCDTCGGVGYVPLNGATDADPCPSCKSRATVATVRAMRLHDVTPDEWLNTGGDMADIDSDEDNPVMWLITLELNQ